MNPINEVVDVSTILDLEDAERRLIHCKKALALANKLPDPADRKKWKSASLVNLNKVRGALNRISKQIEAELADPPEAIDYAPSTKGNVLHECMQRYQAYLADK